MATTTAVAVRERSSLRGGKRTKRIVVYATVLIYLFVVLIPKCPRV